MLIQDAFKQLREASHAFFIRNVTRQYLYHTYKQSLFYYTSVRDIDSVD